MNYRKLLKLPAALGRETWRFVRRVWNNLFRGGHVTLDRWDNITFNENGDTLYDGPYSTMPPHLKARYDQAKRELNANIDYFRRRRAAWQHRQRQQEQTRGR